MGFKIFEGMDYICTLCTYQSSFSWTLHAGDTSCMGRSTLLFNYFYAISYHFY